DGQTPPSMAAGAPAGSYLLSGFESVNPFSGNLSFALPLHAIAGRGAAGYPMTLAIDRNWSLEKLFPDPTNPGVFDILAKADLWAMDDIPANPGYSPGLVSIRQLSVSTGAPCTIFVGNFSYPGVFV